MASIADIAPKPNQRGFLVGMTGSGKSTLAEFLIRQQKHVLAIDPKCLLGADGRGKGHLKGFELIRRPADLPAAGKRNPWLQYRPDPEYQDIESYDQVYRWAFDRKNTFVYTDEVYLVMHGTSIPDGYRACITSGRQRGIGMLHAAQRPAGVPVIVRSESEHYYCFLLLNDDDRKTMAKVMGDVVRDKPPSGHSFYYRAGGGKTRLMSLQLPGGGRK